MQYDHYEPGRSRYDRLPGDEYHAVRAASSTLLKVAHTEGWTAAKHVIAGDRELDSRAVVIGSAVALLIESKQEFDACYREAPPNFKTSTSQKFAAFAKDTGVDAKHLLTETERSQVVRIAAAVKQSICTFRPSDTMRSEVSFFWEEMGVPCKCRPDILVEGPSCSEADYLEIKTANNISPHAVRSAFFRYGYHLQQAFYERGIAQVLHKLPRVTFLFVSTVPPHDVRFYRLSDFDAVAADLTVGELLTEYKRRSDANDWTDDTITKPTIIQMGLGKDADLEGAESEQQTI